MDELWEKIDGYDGYYSISNLGRVMVTGQRKWGHKVGKLIKPFDNNGYVRYRLQLEPGQYKHKLAHVLVFEAFIGRIPFGWEINHIDGDRKHNRPDNLEAVTSSQNQRHAIDVLGKKHSAHRAKLSWDQAESLRAEYAAGGTSYNILAQKYGLYQSTVGRIVNGVNYTNPDLKNRPSTASTVSD